jgi:hypothetical protein
MNNTLFKSKLFVRQYLADSVGLCPSKIRHQRFFHEYFHGDTDAGLGASHQTGRTGLVAKLIQQQGEFAAITK